MLQSHRVRGMANWPWSLCHHQLIFSSESGGMKWDSSKRCPVSQLVQIGHVQQWTLGWSIKKIEVCAQSWIPDLNLNEITQILKFRVNQLRLDTNGFPIRRHLPPVVSVEHSYIQHPRYRPSLDLRKRWWNHWFLKAWPIFSWVRSRVTASSLSRIMCIEVPALVPAMRIRLHVKMQFDANTFFFPKPSMWEHQQLLHPGIGSQSVASLAGRVP